MNCSLTANIYRFADIDDEWTLKVISDGGGAPVWEEMFASDSEAYEAFERALAEGGIGSFTERPTQH